MKLLVAGDFRWDSGSSHVIREYVRHAPDLGIEVAVSSGFGSRDDRVSGLLPYRDDLAWATHLLVVYEGRPFLSEQELAAIDRTFPRDRRAVIDTDGHWGPVVSIAEDNNTGPVGHEAWRKAIAAVSDLVLQPTLREPAAGAVRFPYFGMPEMELSTSATPPLARFDLQYIGNNWYRFDALIALLAAARDVAGVAGRLRVCGRGWDGSVLEGYESGTWADIAAFERLGVEVRGPVPFGQVISSMAQATITPVLMRPVLSALNLLTPRMFETAVAETIPLYTAADPCVGDLYGDDGALCLGAEPRAKFAEIFDNPVRFAAVAREVRKDLATRYAYPAVLAELRELFG